MIADRLRSTAFELRAPELLWAEVAHVVRQRCRRGEVSPQRLRRCLALMQQVWDIAPMANRMLAPAAGELALQLDHGIYDCFYLATAQRLSCRVVTADRRLHDKVEASAVGGLTLWIEDLP